MLWCGPNSRTSPSLATNIVRPTPIATAPLRWAARCSTHLPFCASSSVAEPSGAIRSTRPSSPPLTKPSPVGSAIRASTAPPCRGAAAVGVGAAISAGSSRTWPSPRAKATVLPSRLKAQAATGASVARERADGRVCCQAGLARSSFTMSNYFFRQSSKPRFRLSPSRLRPMNTSLLARASPSFQGEPQSLSIIMWTPW